LEDLDVELLRAAERAIPAETAREKFGESFDLMMDLGLLFEERGRAMCLVFEGLRHELDAGMHGFSGSKGRAESASLSLTF